MPIRDHRSLKSPRLAQHIRQQPFIPRTRLAVDLVIRRHDTLQARIHTRLERWKVDLMQRPSRDLLVDIMPKSLLVVGGKMLRICDQPFILNCFYEFRCQCGRKTRILSISLIYAAVAWIAMDIDIRSEHHVNCIGIHFLCDCTSAAIYGFRIPGCTQQHSRRKAPGKFSFRQTFFHLPEK